MYRKMLKLSRKSSRNLLPPLSSEGSFVVGRKIEDSQGRHVASRER
jgi:hypothetical protein